METMVRLGAWLGVLVTVSLVGVSSAVASGMSDSRVDVAVFELTGEDIEDDLLETLSAVLRQEAQQHDGYSLANPAALQRDEIALVVGCDPDDAGCMRQMGEYVDGQVLIFGDVKKRGTGLDIAVEIFDVTASEEAVRVERRVDDARDPVVAFRREVEGIFATLDSIGQTHLVVDAPRAEMSIRLDGEQVSRGHFEKQGLTAGTYQVSIAEAGDEVWAEEVELEPGRVVAIRPEIDDEGGDVEEVADMQVEATTLVPGESTTPAERIEYDGGRSNVAAFSLMGVGTLSLAASGVMVMQMHSVENQIWREHAEGTLTEERHRELTRRGESYQAAQYVLLTVGAAGLTVGASWAIWNYSRDRREERMLGADVMVTPTGSGISVVGRW